MRQVIEKYAILQMIEAMGFCRFVFRKFGYDIERGVILVVEDSWQAGEIVDAFCEACDAVLIKRKRNKMVRPLNFQIGLHLYGKLDREDWVTEFLMRKDFFPVVVVIGMVPQTLYGSGYIFKMELTSHAIYEFGEMYQTMKSNILEHLDAFIYDLKNLNSSCIAKQYYEEQHYHASWMILATGQAWKMVIREKNDEETTDAWLENYCGYLINELKSMDEFMGQYAVQEAVRNCIFEYVNKHKVVIIGLNEGLGVEKTIFTDENYYYFSESLLKEICSPLTNTISFLQLKSEMYVDGILECNDGHKQNYTVKVTCFDSENNRYIRKRFLKLKRACLLTDSGVSLEDWLVLPKDEEVNEYVD